MSSTSLASSRLEKTQQLHQTIEQCSTVLQGGLAVPLSRQVATIILRKGQYKARCNGSRSISDRNVYDRTTIYRRQNRLAAKSSKHDLRRRLEESPGVFSIKPRRPVLNGLNDVNFRVSVMEWCGISNTACQPSALRRSLAAADPTDVAMAFLK